MACGEDGRLYKTDSRHLHWQAEPELTGCHALSRLALLAALARALWHAQARVHAGLWLKSSVVKWVM